MDSKIRVFTGKLPVFFGKDVILYVYIIVRFHNTMSWYWQLLQNSHFGKIRNIPYSLNGRTDLPGQGRTQLAGSCPACAIPQDACGPTCAPT
jgi:hypothetical protein